MPHIIVLLTLQLLSTSNQRWKRTLDVDSGLFLALKILQNRSKGKKKSKVTQSWDIEKCISGFDIWARVHRNIIIANGDMEQSNIPLINSPNIYYNEIQKDVQNRHRFYPNAISNIAWSRYVYIEIFYNVVSNFEEMIGNI